MDLKKKKVWVTNDDHQVKLDEELQELNSPITAGSKSFDVWKGDEAPQLR